MHSGEHRCTSTVSDYVVCTFSPETKPEIVDNTISLRSEKPHHLKFQFSEFSKVIRIPQFYPLK